MKKTTTLCDVKKCHKEIVGVVRQIEINHIRYDICESCFDIFTKWQKEVLEEGKMDFSPDFDMKDIASPLPGTSGLVWYPITYDGKTYGSSGTGLPYEAGSDLSDDFWESLIKPFNQEKNKDKK